MSETDDIEALGRRVLQQSSSSPLRERMADFVDDHGTSSDLRTVRRDAGSGRPLSEIDVDDRDERL